MDPQANLKRQLELATWITNTSDRLADLRESLVGAFDAQDYDTTTALCVEIMTHETSLEESASELAELVTQLNQHRLAYQKGTE